MFDSINFTAPTRTEYVTRTVHEHRAPTDESVKLLSEMERKAQDKIEKTVRLEFNSLKAVLHHMTEPMNLDTIYVIQLDLNGNRHRCTIQVDSYKSKEERIQQIITEFSEYVAREVLKDLSKELVRVL